MTTQDPKPVSATSGKDLSKTQREQFLSPLDDIDQWFDEMRRNWMHPFFMGRGFPEVVSPFGGRAPRMDVIDRDNEICVRAEIPGVSKDDLEVSLHENEVTIRATTQKEHTEEKGQYYRREMSRGEFQRTVRLPGTVDGEQAKASFKDGVLELIIPKLAGSKRQSIKVE